ncbi:MAG: OB-fold nucleic acid binding domain-containing protein [Halobacteriaceae archaeon]
MSDEHDGFRDASSGAIDNLHEEDVVFSFRGDRSDQLVPGRYYRGTVDGFAEFGVFVDLSDSVTGLLHQSEIPERIENLDWKPGQEVYVQVTDVRDNGDVDLSWSLRQSAEEFRGQYVHDPDASSEQPITPDEETASGSDATDGSDATASGTAGGSGNPSEGAGEAPASGPEESGAAGGATADAEQVAVGDVTDHEGDRVAVEGEITGIEQTGGPTLFEVADETGSVTAAAFDGAGQRAYPDVDADEVVRIEGVVERHRGDVQVETESLSVLGGEAAEQVRAARADAQAAAAEPPETDPLAPDSPVAPVLAGVVEAATAVRRAVEADRPVVVRHPATVDGHVAGAAVERATLDQVRERHPDREAEFDLVDRRPVDGLVYDVDVATDDVTDLSGDDRPPLVVLAGLGGEPESAPGLELLATYDADAVVVDAAAASAEVADRATAVVGDVPAATSTVLAANVAAHVDPGCRDEVAHLPAVSFPGEVPATYADLAADAGFDADSVEALRRAVAVGAYHQRREGKRQLVADLLWPAADGDLVAELSEECRDRIDDAIDTARAHLEQRHVGGTTFAVLDMTSYSHEDAFPPADLLLDALHRAERPDDDTDLVTVGVGEDTLRLRSTQPVDLRAVSETIADRLPEASVLPRGAAEGRIRFVVGERKRVLRTTLETVAERVTGGAVA